MSNALEEKLKALKDENDAMESKLLNEHGSEIFNPAFDYEEGEFGCVNITLGRFVLLFQNEDSVESCRGEQISEIYPEIIKITELPPAKQ